MKINKAALIGLGAIGAFFAPKLHAALGDNFFVIADGDRKKRLEEKGVAVNGETYHFPVKAPSEAEAADLVIVAVKDYALAGALEDIRGFVGPETIILTTLNGVESEEKAAAVYGWERVLYSYMRISSSMTDGAAKFGPGNVHFGEAENIEGAYSERVRALKELFDRAEIPYRIDKDMIRGMWFKFMSNICDNMTCAMLGITFYQLGNDPDASAIAVRAQKEVLDIAVKRGVSLTETDIEKHMASLLKMPPANKPSTLQDLEKGKKTEADMLSGTVMRLGAESGVPTPVNEVLYHGVKALEKKNSAPEA